MDGEEKWPAVSSLQCCSSRMMSPEIVEIADESMSSRDGGGVYKDVYVAVGKDDLDVVKWALDHAVSPGTTRLFLLHVKPPLTYISTPVGRLSRSQLSQEQLRVYINEENNRRRNLLNKYIRICNESKVTVDVMLLESNVTTKAIIDLIPVLNVTNLVMGTKRPPSSRRSGRKKLSKGEVVKKNAPGYCEVTIVHDGKKVVEEEAGNLCKVSTSTRQLERSFFQYCVCFLAGKFNSNN